MGHRGDLVVPGTEQNNVDHLENCPLYTHTIRAWIQDVFVREWQFVKTMYYIKLNFLKQIFSIPE